MSKNHVNPPLPYQQRVIDERSARESELERLDEFRKSSQFLILDREDQVLLNRQSVCMHGLVEVLTERIIRFKL